MNYLKFIWLVATNRSRFKVREPMTSYFDWQSKKQQPKKDLEKTDINITVRPWRYEVKESRLSDTGIHRLRGLTERGKP